MNKRNKIIVSIVGITIVLLALLGITYAYYLTRIQGNTNTNSISVTTAKLELVYGDNSAEILTGTGALTPTVETDADDAIGTKTFTVTNNGNDSSYVVIIDNVSTKIAGTNTDTTFLSNDFRYTLSCTKSDGTKCNDVSDLTIFPIKGGILVSNDIKADDIHTYTLTMWYIDTGVDQSDDMGKTYQARVNISDVAQMENPFMTGVTATDNASLAYNIIKNAKEKKNGTELTNTPLTSPANETNATWGSGEFTTESVATSSLCDGYNAWLVGDTVEAARNGNTVISYNDALNKYVYDQCSRWTKFLEAYDSATSTLTFRVEKITGESIVSLAEDDDGISYYYRGLPEDNYVTFAGMCWRIVRIDGNRNTKLILEDQDEVCSTTMNGNWDIEVSDGTSITMDTSVTPNVPYRIGNFGYVDSTGKYKMSYLNPVDNSNRALVNAFKYFQINTLSNKISNIYSGKSLSDYLVSGNWCLNDKTYSDSTGTTLLENPSYTSTFFYDSYVRLSGKTTKEPTLKCPVETMETFGDNTTPMYVGTLTADEIVYAGGIVDSNNLNYYLINKWQRSNSIYFWTLSPSSFTGFFDTAFYVFYDGCLGVMDVSFDFFYAPRPAVILSSSALITGGEGTLEKPYVIG